MKKYFRLLVLFLVLYSCKKGNDPLLNFKFGSSESDWKTHLNELTKNKILVPDKYENYYSYLFDGVDSFKVVYKINNPFPSSGYKIYSDYKLYQNNKLRNIEIDLKGDTICSFNRKTNNFSKSEIKGYGPRRKVEVDRIRKYLIKFYGKPAIKSDSIESAYRNDLSSGVLKKDFEFSKYVEYKDGQFQGIKLKDQWVLKDFTVELYREIYYYDSCFKDTFYPSAYIVYKMNDYENELNRIKQNIINNLKPNDLVSIEFLEPTFKSFINNFGGGYYNLSQSIGTISRKGPEEKRLITDIKFDIVYLNRFGEEIARINDCLYEFKGGLGAGLSLMLSGRTYYNLEYNPYYGEGKSFEYIRKHIEDYQFGGKGKIVSIIKKVVFEDGKVLE